jgi:hypothetical protein
MNLRSLLVKLARKRPSRDTKLNLFHTNKETQRRKDAQSE